MYYESAYEGVKVEMSKKHNKVVVDVLRKMGEQAEEAYRNCYAECCGKYTNKGCCGDYVQAWSERDRVVMETLGEHINKLSELICK